MEQRGHEAVRLLIRDAAPGEGASLRVGSNVNEHVPRGFAEKWLSRKDVGRQTRLEQQQAAGIGGRAA